MRPIVSLSPMEQNQIDYLTCVNFSMHDGEEYRFVLSVMDVFSRYVILRPSSSSTAEGIFSRINAALNQNGISWQNVVGINLDNNSVNMGCRNSIKTRVIAENSATYHVVNNTAVKKGA